MKELVEAMKNTYQIPGKQTVWDHGVSVKNYTFDLINHLRNGTPLKYQWKVPSFLYMQREYILDNLVPDSTLYLYTVFHDCGKPRCRQVDDQGKVHYPDHANVSADLIKEYFPLPILEKLVRMDMVLHTMKAEDIPEFAKHREAVSLLIVALAEVHSNAELFGGMDSISFKIKLKHIEQRGKALMRTLNPV